MRYYMRSITIAILEPLIVFELSRDVTSIQSVVLILNMEINIYKITFQLTKEELFHQQRSFEEFE